MAMIEKSWKSGPFSSAGGGVEDEVNRFPTIARAFRTEGISDAATDSLNRWTMLGERSIALILVTEGPRARDMVPVPQA